MTRPTPPELEPERVADDAIDLWMKNDAGVLNGPFTARHAMLVAFRAALNLTESEIMDRIADLEEGVR